MSTPTELKEADAIVGALLRLADDGSTRSTTPRRWPAPPGPGVTFGEAHSTLGGSGADNESRHP